MADASLPGDTGAAGNLPPSRGFRGPDGGICHLSLLPTHRGHVWKSSAALRNPEPKGLATPLSLPSQAGALQHQGADNPHSAAPPQKYALGMVVVVTPLLQYLWG